jgi:hypothetical protein
MKHVSELRAILSQFFDWHKCRLDCLGQIIQALFVVRTINLTQVALAFKSEDRIGLLKRVVERLGINRIEVLLADREFKGTHWFLFLIEQKIPFIIRVKWSLTSNSRILWECIGGVGKSKLCSAV